MQRPPTAPGYQTPAPLGKLGQQFPAPATAPAILNLPAVTSAFAAAPGTVISAAYTPAGLALTPAAGLQTPGLFIPAAAGGVSTGMIGSGLLRGVGARVPGMVTATTGPRGGLVFSNAMQGSGVQLGSAARPPTGPGALGLGITTGSLYAQPGVSLEDPAAVLSAGMYAGWSAVGNGLYGVTGQPQALDTSAGISIGNSTDLAAVQQAGVADASSVDAAGAIAAQQQPAIQLAYQQQTQQQQLRAQMMMLGQAAAAAGTGGGTMQYGGALQQAGETAVGQMVNTVDAAQQQQWLLLQQGQQQMMWPTTAAQVQSTSGMQF